MPYTEHRVFQIYPEVENLYIWRYMDFTKFLNILENKALFFTRADKFEDPLEGTYSRYNSSVRGNVYKDQYNFDCSLTERISAALSQANQQCRPYTCVNCWHINSFESEAMWKLYLKSNEGIAIQSSYQRLIRAVADYPEDVYIGCVKYIDFNRDWMPEGNSLAPFVHKHKAFTHEKELRAIVTLPHDPPGPPQAQFSIAPPEYGIDVMVNLDELIDSIILAPTCPGWVEKLVRSVIDRYGLSNKPVRRSDLDAPPVYF